MKKYIFSLLVAVLLFSCAKQEENNEAIDDPIIEKEEMQKLEEIQKKEAEKLDSFKKANGITD